MSSVSRGVRSLLFLAFAPWGTVSLVAQSAPPVELMDRQEEIRLALSAGPPSLHAGAAVSVFTAEGYRLARRGSNGFHCFVERTADPQVRAPQCVDAIGSEYVLPVKFEEARLRLAGRDEEEIEREIDAGFASGRFRPVPAPAFSYMLSGGQYLGRNVGRWNPHVMVYTPYRTNEEIGGLPGTPQYPFIAFDEGKPLALTVIVTTEFVDPASVELGG